MISFLTTTAWGTYVKRRSNACRAVVKALSVEVTTSMPEILVRQLRKLGEVAAYALVARDAKAPSTVYALDK